MIWNPSYDNVNSLASHSTFVEEGILNGQVSSGESLLSPVGFMKPRLVEMLMLGWVLCHAIILQTLGVLDVITVEKLMNYDCV